MDDNVKKAPVLKFPGTNWWNGMLTAVIVCVRAFQPNAEPMSHWSASSWLWMTLPMWGPAMFGAICAVVFLVMWLWANSKSTY